METANQILETIINHLAQKYNHFKLVTANTLYKIPPNNGDPSLQFTLRLIENRLLITTYIAATFRNATLIDLEEPNAITHIETIIQTGINQHHHAIHTADTKFW